MSRWAAIAGVVVAVAVVTVAPTGVGAGSGDRDASADYDGGAIRGAVVDFATQRVLGGRTVAIGGERTVTDAAGRFSIAHAPAVYDVAIVEGDRTSVTVYRGLRRRDPLLVHKIHRENRWRAPRWAAVHGMLSGGGAYPALPPDYAVVYLFSEQETMGRELFDPELPGPTFRPLSVGWEGVSSVGATLVAVRRGPGGGAVPAAKGGGGRPQVTPTFAPWVGYRRLTLTGGDTAVDVALTRPRVVHISASSDGDSAMAFFHLHYPNAILPLTWFAQSAAYDFAVPDLRALGGAYCVQASAARGQSHTVRCKISPGANTVALTVGTPPRLSPSPETASPGMSFAWTGDDWRVYMLEIDVGFPTPANPSLYILTTEQSVAWPDLSALGVPFPEGAAAYNWRVRGLGPYADLDEATGGDGLGAIIPTEARQSVSATFAMTVPPAAAPPRKGAGDAAAPACDYPESASIVCNQYTSVDDRELYVLSAINNKLRRYPAFADSIGMTCVRDCAGARAFIRAYQKYRTQHPGFDANEPRAW